MENILASLFIILSVCAGCNNNSNKQSMAGIKNNNADSLTTESIVYFSSDISPKSLMTIYKALGREIKGNNIAVKLSTGEKGNNNYLSPALIKDFVQSFKATIIECNTAYDGARNSYQDHIKVAQEHGFTSIADVDIMDKDGEVEIPIKNGKHLKNDLVGKNLLNYDFLIVLSHFKGHAMGGFGGSIKNMSIGCASRNGKARIHSAGATDDPVVLWDMLPEQDIWLESMAEGAKAITDYFSDRIIHISIANNLSVDCDCDGNPHDPCMPNIGIFASLDPVALDKACCDAVRNSTFDGKEELIERIDSRHGMHTLDYAQTLGMGNQSYKLVNLDK